MARRGALLVVLLAWALHLPVPDRQLIELQQEPDWQLIVLQEEPVWRLIVPQGEVHGATLQLGLPAELAAALAAVLQSGCQCGSASVRLPAATVTMNGIQTVPCAIWRCSNEG